MKKLVIAVSSTVLCFALAEVLTQYETHCCHTESAALLLLETQQPDILVMELPFGLSVLEKTVYTPPVILALTNIATDALLEAAKHAGVQDLILIPCAVQHIVNRLAALGEKSPAPERSGAGDYRHI